MFRFDGTKWVLYRYKISYTQKFEVYDDILSSYPADAVVEDITLTPEQTKRLEAVTDEIPISDLTAFVMDDADVPGMEDYRKDSAIKGILSTLTDEQAEANATLILELAEEWQPDKAYERYAYIQHEGGLYKVLQAHTSQEDWTPDLAPSLFAPLLTSPTGEPLEWVKPDSTNPYMMGDKVIFEGKIYESLIDNNIWSPTEYPQGWYTEPVLEEWSPTKLYKIGERALFEGKPHESVIDNNSWSPAAYAAGWKEIPVA